MSSTYSGNPSTSDRDQVRFLLSDTGPTVWELTDDEVDWLLTEYTAPMLAAAAGARKLAAKYAAGAQSKRVGDLMVQQSQDRAGEYRALSDWLTGEYAKASGAAPWANPSALGAEARRGAMDYR